MVSRVANICFDAHDPEGQAQWWAQVLEDFRPPTAEERVADFDEDEHGLVGPDDRYLLFEPVPAITLTRPPAH